MCYTENSDSSNALVAWYVDSKVSGTASSCRSLLDLLLVGCATGNGCAEDVTIPSMLETYISLVLARTDLIVCAVSAHRSRGNQNLCQGVGMILCTG